MNDHRHERDPFNAMRCWVCGKSMRAPAMSGGGRQTVRERGLHEIAVTRAAREGRLALEAVMRATEEAIRDGATGAEIEAWMDAGRRQATER